MFRTVSPAGFSLRESRLIHERESGFGEHMREYGRDLTDTYFTDKRGLDRALGAIGAAASVLLKGGDELYKGAIGQTFHPPHGIAGHTRADLKSLVGNIVTLHPLRAAGDLWSLATADLPLDAINLVTGNNLSTRRNATRNELSRTLASSSEHPEDSSWSERRSPPKSWVIPSSRSPWDRVHSNSHHRRPPMGVSEDIRHVMSTRASQSA